MNDEMMDLQSRLAFQEDAIEQLTLTVSLQQNKINNLELAIKHLHKQLQNLTPTEGPGGGHELPPHY